jgi:myo-inositol-1-phosphate synthase
MQTRREREKEKESTKAKARKTIVSYQVARAQLTCFVNGYSAIMVQTTYVAVLVFTRSSVNGMMKLIKYSYRAGEDHRIDYLANC